MTPKAKHFKIKPEVREVKEFVKIIKKFDRFVGNVNFYYSLMQLRKRAEQ